MSRSVVHFLFRTLLTDLTAQPHSSCLIIRTHCATTRHHGRGALLTPLADLAVDPICRILRATAPVSGQSDSGHEVILDRNRRSTQTSGSSDATDGADILCRCASPWKARKLRRKDRDVVFRSSARALSSLFGTTRGTRPRSSTRRWTMSIERIQFNSTACGRLTRTAKAVYFKSLEAGEAE